MNSLTRQCSGAVRSILLALVVACSISAPALATDKVKYGLLAGPQTVYIGIEKGFFAKHGIDVEPVVFRSGAEMVPALSTGRIDIGATAAGAALYNAMARGVNAKIVGDYIVFDRLPSLSGVVARKALYDTGKIRTLQDLKGTKIAVTARGQAMHMFVNKALEKVGLTENDVTLVFMPQPDMLVALRSGAVDVMVNSDPFITIAQDESIGVEIANMWTIVPDLTLGVVMYGERVLVNRDLGVRFMKGFIEANRYLRANDNPRGRKEIVPIYQKHFPVKDPALYERSRLGVGRDTMAVNVHGSHGLAEQLKWYAGHGLVPSLPSIEDIVDPSFAREAAQALER